MAGSLTSAASAARYDGTLTLRVIDEKTRQPIAARMELRNARGRPVKVRAKNTASYGDSFAFDGEVTLQLRKGKYEFLIEAGPEYQTRPGHFTIDRRAEDSTEVELRRVVDMQAEGWWAGDLDVSLSPRELTLMMKAAGVDFVPRSVATTAPPVTRARDANNHDNNNAIFAPLPFAWKLPLWVANGELDAVQIIHRHALADDVVDNEGDGRPRDKTFFPGKTGNGRWSETIYHHLLNCGLRIPPVAGSGSGANDNPVGTNRVYVHCGEDSSVEPFSSDAWFAGLRAGQVIVTNGPLLRTQISGHPPGHEFQLDDGETRDFQIALDLAFYEKAPVEYLEIIKNGTVLHNIRLDELAKKQGRLPPVPFDDSGWLLVRAITSSTKNYQYATTGPYYVQANYQPRISRASVQFFLDWLDAAAEEFADNKAVLADIATARPFWEALLPRTNAE